MSSLPSFLCVGGTEVLNEARTRAYLRNCLGDSSWQFFDDCDCPPLAAHIVVGGCALVLDGTAGTFASTPDKAALDIPGDLAIVVYDVALVNWAPSVPETFAAKFATSGNQRSWWLAMVNTDIRFQLSPDGVAVQTALRPFTSAPSAGELVPGLACTRRQSDGRIQFFRLVNGAWQQQGADLTLGTSAIFDSTAQVTIGARVNAAGNHLNGRIGRVEIYASSDINNLTDLRASPYFSAQAPGTTSFTDAQGNCVWEHDTIMLADGRILRAGDLVGQEFEMLAWDEDDATTRPRRAWAEWNKVEPVYRLTTESGREIVRNAHHPVWAGVVHTQKYYRTLDGRQTNGNRVVNSEWRGVADLRPGVDAVLVPTEVEPAANNSLPFAEAALLGYLLGDGNMTTREVRFTNMPGPALDEFIMCAESLGGIVKDYPPAGKARDVVIRGPGSSKPGSNPINALVRSWGLMGTKGVDRDWPDFVWSLNPTTIATILGRLFACDGWVSIHEDRQMPQIGITLSNERMIRGVQRLMLRLGISGTVSLKRRAGRAQVMGRNVSHRNVWEWKCTADSFERFVEVMDVPGKNEALGRVAAIYRTQGKKLDWRTRLAPEGYRWERVRSVEQLPGLHRTVAIEVEDDHTWVDLVVEHNTWTLNGNAEIACTLDEYGSPASDPAPWYSAQNAASEKFFGFIPERIESSVPTARRSTARLDEGSVLGPEQLLSRTYSFRGWLVAADEEGMRWGMRWMQEVLRGRICAPGCAGDDGELLISCADPTYFRSLVGVGLIDGPRYDVAVPDNHESVAVPTQFQIATERSYLYRDPSEVVNGTVVAGTSECAFFTTEEWFDGADLQIEISSEANASDLTLTMAVSLDGTCDEQSQPCAKITIPLLPAEGRLTIDGRRRQVRFFNPTRRTEEAGYRVVDWTGAFPYFDVAPCAQMCICLDNAGPSPVTWRVTKYEKEL